MSLKIPALERYQLEIKLKEVEVVKADATIPDGIPDQLLSVFLAHVRNPPGIRSSQSQDDEQSRQVAASYLLSKTDIAARVPLPMVQ